MACGSNDNIVILWRYRSTFWTIRNRRRNKTTHHKRLLELRIDWVLGETLDNMVNVSCYVAVGSGGNEYTRCSGRTHNCF